MKNDNKFQSGIANRTEGAPRFRTPTVLPVWPMPDNACDAHMHIFGPYSTFPVIPTAPSVPAQASIAQYLAMASHVGLQRMVVVQPSFYGLDNACTLDLVARMEGRGRAVIVVDSAVTQDALHRFHQQGARGVRLQSVVPGGVSIDEMEMIASKIKDFGWHIALFVDDEQLPALNGRLRKLDVPVVLDHMAHLREDASDNALGVGVILDLMERGNCWVKLSNAFFPPSGQRAMKLIAANNERVLWGSDWPHVGYLHAPPDEGQALNNLAQWAGSQDIWNKILSENPHSLYFK